MKGKFLALAAVGMMAFAFSAVGPVHADPADRVAVGAGVIEVFECSTAFGEGGIVVGDLGGGIPAMGVAIIPAFSYKSNTAADLIFHFSTECTLFTFVKGKSNDNDFETSKAGVIIWIELSTLTCLPSSPRNG